MNGGGSAEDRREQDGMPPGDMDTGWDAPRTGVASSRETEAPREKAPDGGADRVRYGGDVLRTDGAREHSSKPGEVGYEACIPGEMPDAVVILDEVDLVREANPAFCALTGHMPDEILGRDFFTLVEPGDSLALRLVAEECRHNPGIPLRAEAELLHGDGTYHRHEMALSGLGDGCVSNGVAINTRDVSERVRLKDALTESREALRVLDEQTMLGMIVFQDEEVRYMNQAAADILECPVEVYKGMSKEERRAFIYPEDREFIVDQLLRKERGEETEPVSHVYRIVTPTGKVKWAEGFSRSVIYGGRPAAFAVFLDITERKVAEESQREREEYFRSLIENSLDVILIVDQRNLVKYVSPSVQRFFGYTPEEVLGELGMGFIPQEELALALGEFARVLQDPESISEGEFHARCKDGTWKEVSVKARNMFWHPMVQGVLVNIQDVTEQKAIARRLEAINQLFLGLGADLIANMERIVEGAKDLLGGSLAAYCRLEKGKLSIISTEAGERSFLVTGEPDDYLAYRIIESGAGEPHFIDDLRRSREDTRDPLAMEYGLLSFLGVPVLVRGENQGCLCVYWEKAPSLSGEDTGTAVMLARALSSEEERLAHEQSLKDFIDVAGHELRHPVTLLKGYALTLLDYWDRLDVETKREYLRVMSQGADRLDSLIRELLDVSRIERGRFVVMRRLQPLEPLLQRAIEEVRAKGVSQELKFSLHGELAPREVDAEKLVQVMVILLDNAVAHSPERLEIEVTAEEKDGQALISDLDHGVGVPEKERKRIFERFYQVEDALHHPTRGMGLGLYIAREIVEAHGGRIWHEHRPGGGSIFRFTIA